MEFRFDAEEWKAMAPTERVRLSRLWAAETLKLGDGAPKRLREAYLCTAAGWLKVAAETEWETK